MTSDRGNQGPAPIERDEEPLDPDIQLITDYLGHELSAEQEAEVEERLVNNEAFYEKVIPYMKIWTEPVDYRKELAVYELEQREAASAPKTDARIGETRRRTPYRFFTRPRVSAVLAAASLLIWVGAPAVTYQIGVADGRERELVQTFPAPDQMPAPEIGQAPVERVARAARVGRSTFVHVHAGSRFAYKSVLFGFVQAVGLNGEGSVEVGWLDPWVIVSTPAGTIRLSHGTYAFHSTGDPDPETLVTVVRGKATLEGSSSLKTPDVVLTTGQHGRLAYPAPPQRTAGGAGYPALDQSGRLKP